MKKRSFILLLFVIIGLLAYYHIQKKKLQQIEKNQDFVETTSLDENDKNSKFYDENLDLVVNIEQKNIIQDPEFNKIENQDIDSQELSAAGILEKNSLIGSWQWESYSKEGAKDIIAPNVESFSIDFQETGKVLGTTDCNNFFSNYFAKADLLNFKPFMSTKMFCEGSSEFLFHELLRKVTKYTLEGNKLMLLGNDIKLIFSRI